MGTRADFYMGGTDPGRMTWLGSIAWDGYPDGVDQAVLRADSEEAYVEAVTAFLANRQDGTRPEQGWPWPWADSGATDYAYTWADGRVLASTFGCAWFEATGEEPEDAVAGAVEARGNLEGGNENFESCGSRIDHPFPDMTATQNIAWDKRSGLITLWVEDEP